MFEKQITIITNNNPNITSQLLARQIVDSSKEGVKYDIRIIGQKHNIN